MSPCHPWAALGYWCFGNYLLCIRAAYLMLSWMVMIFIPMTTLGALPHFTHEEIEALRT